MTKRKFPVSSDQPRRLYEWAEKNLHSSLVTSFLRFCEHEMKEAIDMITYSEYKLLEEKFFK